MPAPVLVDAVGAPAALPLALPDPPRGMRGWTLRLAGFLRTSPVAGDSASIAGLSAVSVAATVAAPVLLDHPLLLVALTPRLPFLLLAAPGTPWPLFVAVAGLRLCLADVAWFRIGRGLGPTVVERFPRLGRRLLAAAPRTRQVAVAVAVLVRPIGRHLALAGAFGASPRLIGLLDVVGTGTFLLAVHAGTSAMVS